MEKAGYREALGVLREKYPDRLGLSVMEVAKELNVNMNTVYSAIKRVHDPLPHQKLCGKIIIPITALARWLA